MNVTIKDLAKYCNYSVTTVSYASNGSKEIPETTRNKILKAAEEGFLIYAARLPLSLNRLESR